VKVVVLRPGDEELLCKAEAAFNAEPTRERAALLLREPTYLMVVALTDDGEVMSRIYGHVLHRAEVTDFLLYEVDTAEPHKRKGAARALIAKLRELGRAKGWAEMWVLTDVDNDEGNPFYESVGGTLENSPANMYVFKIAP
jgi:GNAT superfamily N-acetyltransferase